MDFLPFWKGRHTQTNIHHRRDCSGQKVMDQIFHWSMFPTLVGIPGLGELGLPSKVLVSTCKKTLQFLILGCLVPDTHTHTHVWQAKCAAWGYHLSCVLFFLPCLTGQVAHGEAKPRAQSCQGYYVSVPKQISRTNCLSSKGNGS